MLRDACLDDLPALLALEAGFPGDRLSARQFRHHLLSPLARLRLLESEGVVAYSLLLRHARRRDWRVYSIVVDPARRGQGWGSWMLEDALKLAREGGAAGLRLEVRPDNPGALALYLKHGFAVIGRRADYYEDGEEAILLRRSLAP